ncbi:hypothetical protein BKA82DRAFT_162691, partial [Pisolithus tinctorius]
ISAIFQYHSTVLMNFVTDDSVFCAYPELTFELRSLVNPFVIFGQPLNRGTLEAVLKYCDRGIRYIECKDVHQQHACRKDHYRSIYDECCMWMTIDAARKSHSLSMLQLHFKELGVTNVKWRLGGYICRRTPSFSSSIVLVFW